MKSIDLKQYNTYLEDFEWFFLSKETELVNSLYDAKLLDDNFIKNIDTKKIFHQFLIKNTISRIHGHPEKHIFLVKPEIISDVCEVCRYFDKRALRREFMIFFKFMVKNKFNIYVFMKKSYSDVEDIFNLESPDVKDFLEINIIKSRKLLFSKKETVDSLVGKIHRKINQKSAL